VITGRRITVAMFLVTGAILLTKGIVPTRAAAPPAIPTSDEPDSNVPTLMWKTDGVDGTTAAVVVVGIAPRALHALLSPDMTLERWTSFLTVRVAREGPADAKTKLPPPLWGSYRVEAKVLRFQPRFPLEPGLRYRAEFDPSKFEAIIRVLSQAAVAAESEPRPFTKTKMVADFAIPKRLEHPTSTVTAVYPSCGILPENLLRFYIHFSGPMSRGEAYNRIKLLDSMGKPVLDPFLELAEELWSTDGTRFTLLFDPGRVKRGLKPREEVGPVLEAGRSYCLVIERDWPDARERVSQAISGSVFGRFVARSKAVERSATPRQHARSARSRLPRTARPGTSRSTNYGTRCRANRPGRRGLDRSGRNPLAIHTESTLERGKLPLVDRN
jgi:hypothetical protein